MDPVASRLTLSPAANGSLFMRLGSSPRLVAVLGILHAGALPCVFANQLPLLVQSFIALGVLLSAVRGIALHGVRRAGRSVVLLIWDRHGRWRLLQRDGAVLDAHLEQGAYAHPRLTVLPFRCLGGQRRCVLLVADMVDADHFRQLRVRLRCEPPERLG
jgi:hypothetical protein